MRNSDPLVRMVLVYETQFLISTPYLPCRQLVVSSNAGPLLVFPRIQPFGSDEFSSPGKVYSRQATESVNCEKSSVSFVMKYCPASTVVRNPASVRDLRLCSAGSSPAHTTGFRGAPRGEHLSTRSRPSVESLFFGPIRFPQHLFSVHDHGRQRSDREPHHISSLTLA